MACPYIANDIDPEVALLRRELGLNLRCERILRPRLDVLTFPEEFLIERYRFSRESIIYLNKQGHVVGIYTSRAYFNWVGSEDER